MIVELAGLVMDAGSLGALVYCAMKLSALQTALELHDRRLHKLELAARFGR